MAFDDGACKRTPPCWIQALAGMTEGYHGDLDMQAIFKRECEDALGGAGCSLVTRGRWLVTATGDEWIPRSPKTGLTGDRVCDHPETGERRRHAVQS
jgi:hypothetical protein